MTKAKVVAALKELINPEKAAYYPRFFKTGKGEYGEGDKFLGVTVPNQRKVARRFRDLSEREIVKLLDDSRHECRARRVRWSFPPQRSAAGSCARAFHRRARHPAV